MYFKLLLASFLFFSTFIDAQDTIPRHPPCLKTVLAFVKGHPYEVKLEREIFSRDFELCTTNPEYTVVDFFTSWDYKNGDIVERRSIGSKITVNVNDSTPTEADMIVFDHIIVKKGKEYFVTPSQVIMLVDSITAQRYKKELALCVVLVNGHVRMKTINAPGFQNDIIVELTDTSYKLIDFNLIVNQPDGTFTSTTITAHQIVLDKDYTTKLLKGLIPGSTVSLEDIRVIKNGRQYQMPEYEIYVK